MRSEIFYFNDKNELVDKEIATHAIIRECDMDGNLVNEIYSKIVKDEQTNELSEEDRKLLEEYDEKYSSSLRKC